MEQVWKSVLQSAVLWKCINSQAQQVNRVSPTFLRTLNNQKKISKSHKNDSENHTFKDTRTCLFEQTVKFSERTCSVSVLLRHSTPCRNVISKSLTSSTAVMFSLGGSRHFSTTVTTLSADTSGAESVATAMTAAVSGAGSSELLYPDFFLIKGAETVIGYIHQLTGLPWWSSIILTAFLLRVVLMVPLTVHTFQNMARLQRLQPEVKEMTERLKKEVAMAMRQFGWDKERARKEYDKNLKRLMRNLYIRDNCHPMKGTAAFWVQTPVWLSVSYALRNMSLRAQNPDIERHEEFSTLSDGGVAWFPDLTCVDSTWLLPAMMGAVTLLNVEMNYLNVPEVTKYRKRLTFALRLLALAFIPISAACPSAMVLYWVSSGTLAGVQNILFEYSPFRRLVGLPQSPIESASPIRSLVKKAKARYFKT